MKIVIIVILMMLVYLAIIGESSDSSNRRLRRLSSIGRGNISNAYWNKMFKIAVIGKSLSGALCTYYLRKLIPNIIIDVYDHMPKKKRPGDYTLIHSEYKYANEILKEFQINPTPLDENSQRIIYDGVEFYPFHHSILEKNDPSSYNNLKQFVLESLRQFRNVYQLQTREKIFNSVGQLLDEINSNFSEFSKIGILDLFHRKYNLKATNLTKTFLRATTINSCMQNLRLNAFTGIAKLFHSELTGEMSRILIETIISKLLLPANVVSSDILEINRQGRFNWIKYLKDGKPEKIAYNFVVIATNAVKNINFHPFKIPYEQFEYLTYYGTYVRGQLHPTIGSPASIKSVINVKKFQAILRMPPNTASDFCIVGFKKAEESDLENILKVDRVVAHREIRSFHDHSNYDRIQSANFVLAEDLYNVNAIEWASDDSIEFLAISAKNVALLIARQFSHR